jgi:hypothetical protein
MWYWHKSRSSQWNKIEIAEINTFIYNVLIFHKGTRIYKGDRKVFLINDVGH